MTKCLFKALKAVDLDQHVGLFRSLGYDSAGALANFRAEHFEKLNFNEQELLRLIALLDVLKESTREGKICPHYFNTNKTTKQSSPIKPVPIQASWSDDIGQQRNSQSTVKKQFNTNVTPKRQVNSMVVTGRSSSASMASTKSINKHSDDINLQRPSTVISRQNQSILTKTNNQRYSAPKSFLNRPAIQHVKVKSYNYGIPSNKRSRNGPYRGNHQFTSVSHHSSIFVSSSHNTNDTVSHVKPAEIYVYARKRPLLSGESNFQDMITVPDNKRIIIAENKANLDCTPLLKKTEFEFDQVFGSDASNKYVFESTVLPLISTNYRHNLTYICFGQTGSGKSHTIFGSKNTDGLLIYCTQLLLHETNSESQLVCSFYEIYNNQVYDLVNDGKRLFVREDGDHHVNVIGLTEITLQNLDSLRCVIDDGLTRRHHGKSAFNSNSSRSHAIFQIILKNSYNSSESFRLIFIDLAGSERATDAQNNLRQTRREGAQINWSLLALKECIRSMDMTHSHAPFRQSKLTHILRDSLTGSKTRTCLMANVSPPDDCCQCSLNTLQYASRIRDISMRHRHRSMPITNMQMSFFDDTLKQQETVQEKSQRTFKPATASTPVHRLISSVDQNIYKLANYTDIDERITKTIDIDWQIADDDIPISGSGDNLPVKSLNLSTRECIINTNTSNHKQNNKHYSNRLQNKNLTDMDESPSSYFPQPQSNIKSSSSVNTSEIKRSYDSARLMYDDGNERQWKTVPAPTMSRLSNSMVETSNSLRIVPVAPIPLPNENQYNSTVGKENLGTRTTKIANHSPRCPKPTQQNGLVENLDLSKKYEPNTIMTDVERTLYSDRSTTLKDQTEFLSNRDELLSIVSSRLAGSNRRASSVTTPRSKKQNSVKESFNSPYLNKSKTSLSSTTKNHQKTRQIKSASSTASLINANQGKKSMIDNKKAKVTSSINFQKFHSTTRPSVNRSHHGTQQRTVPLRVHHGSDYDEHDKMRDNFHRQKSSSTKGVSYLTGTEACQKTHNMQFIIKKEEEEDQADKYIFHEYTNFNKISAPSPLLSVPNSSPLPIYYTSPTYVSSNLVQAPLDQVKLVFHRSLEQPISPLSSTHVNNPWQTTISYSSPSKDFGVRVSDQLNSLRSLLETRLTHQDENKLEKPDSSLLDSSPGTFAREFLQSLRQSSFKTSSREFISNFRDEDKEVERNFRTDKNHIQNEKFQAYEGDALSTTTTTTTTSNQHGYSSIHSHHFGQIIHPNLSALSDELNQAKVNMSVTSSSTSTITSNLAAKIDTQEVRNLSSHGDNNTRVHQLSNENHHTVNDNKDIRENVSNPASDSERTSQVNSTLQNPFAGTSSGGSSSNESRSRSPVLIQQFSTYDIISSTNHGHDNLLDSGKNTSFLTGSSFDALLNSLKTMREKELGFVVPTSDDKLIPVAD